MYLKLFKNDIKNNFFQSLSIAFFVFLSSALLATAGHLGVQLSSSVNDLLLQARTPHLLQMHKGEIDMDAMEAFVRENPQIEHFQVLSFLNVDNSSLSFQKAQKNPNSPETPATVLPLKDSVYDNGFSVQSPKFDFLLDLEGNLIQADQGEVYVPLFYKNDLQLQKGDLLIIRSDREIRETKKRKETKETEKQHLNASDAKQSDAAQQGQNTKEIGLKIAGFVRDSQMNSSLSVSKRFIVHQEDYRKIAENTDAQTEFLIEFRLKDLNDSAKIEANYARQGLKSNGPPMINYRLFQLVNAFSDGIMMLTLVLISGFMIGISLLCIRFTLLAKLEEEEKELIVLKAIGIPMKKIQMLFLSKYLFLCALFCILGFFSSYLIKIPLLRNMSDFFGMPRERWSNSLLAFTLSMAVFATIFLAMKKVSNRIRRLEMTRSNLSDRFSSHKKLYFTMASVLILSFLILILPNMISSTMSDKSFVNYLGVGSYEVRMDFSQINEHAREIQALISDIEADDDVISFNLSLSKWMTYLSDTKEKQRIWVEFSDQKKFPIRYIEGREPISEDEISLSKLQAQELSKKVGEELEFLLENKYKKLKISGIYSDLTNGGKTAKMNKSASLEDPDVIWAILALKLKKGVDANDVTMHYRTRYTFAKISDTESYLKQIFGNTLSMIDLTDRIAYLSSVTLIFMITLLFVKMIYIKDQSENALLKSLGYTTAQIQRKYYLAISRTVALGFLLGTLISLSIGDILARGALSLIGVHGVVFLRDGFFSYFIIPVSIWISAMLATMVAVRGIRTMNLAFLLKEDVT